MRQSGGQPASHGRITKQGRAHARGMLVEAAWAAAKTPGPLRAFYERVRARRGMQIAVVATARKLAVLCWHLIDQRRGLRLRAPSLTAQEAARARAARRHALPPRAAKAPPPPTTLKEVAPRERELAEQAERAYRQIVADWQAEGTSDEERAWPPPMGRDCQGPQAGQAARQDFSPRHLLFARGSTTPTAKPNPN